MLVEVKVYMKIVELVDDIYNFTVDNFSIKIIYES